jgi:hypothetical protein
MTDVNFQNQPPEQPNQVAERLCLVRLDERKPAPEQHMVSQQVPDRPQVRARVREHYGRLGALTAEQVQALDRIIDGLLGNAQDLTALNNWCTQFQNNPAALRDHFNRFAQLMGFLGLQVRVESVIGPGGNLQAVCMDIPVAGTRHSLRLSSHPQLGGFVVTRGTVLNNRGEEVPIEQIIPNNSPIGAGRGIALWLREAVRQPRER